MTTSEAFIRTTVFRGRAVITARASSAAPFDSLLKEHGVHVARATHQTLREAERWTSAVLGLEEEREPAARDTERAPAQDGAAT